MYQDYSSSCNKTNAPDRCRGSQEDRPETDELDAASILVPYRFSASGINILLLLMGFVFTEIRDSVGLSPQYVVDQGTSRPLCSELVAQLKTSIMFLRSGNGLTRDLCSTLVPCLLYLFFTRPQPRSRIAWPTSFHFPRKIYVLLYILRTR
jgi:hypothetical protein